MPRRRPDGSRCTFSEPSRSLSVPGSPSACGSDWQGFEPKVRDSATTHARGESKKPDETDYWSLMNGWTPERRALQAQAIRCWRPWDHSTGPRTAEGKETSARNAYKGGHWRREREFLKTARQVLRDQREVLRTI